MNSLRQQGANFGRVGSRAERRLDLPHFFRQTRQTRHPLFRLPEQRSLDAEGIDRPARRSRLEAVLFLAREPLSLRRLAQLANLTDGTEARTVLRSLQARYDERQSAFQVTQVAGGYQLLSRREFARWLRPHADKEQEFRLTTPALETLVVVAYRQPALRAEVEAIRGVACGEILRQLLERDLLRIVGRSEELGRPLRYGTTKRFLEVFGLSNLEELPWAAQLRRTTQTEPESAELGSKFASSNADLTGGGEDT